MDHDNPEFDHTGDDNAFAFNPSDHLDTDTQGEGNDLTDTPDPSFAHESIEGVPPLFTGSNYTDGWTDSQNPPEADAAAGGTSPDMSVHFSGDTLGQTIGTFPHPVITGSDGRPEDAATGEHVTWTEPVGDGSYQ